MLSASLALGQHPWAWKLFPASPDGSPCPHPMSHAAPATPALRTQPAPCSRHKSHPAQGKAPEEGGTHGKGSGGQASPRIAVPWPTLTDEGPARTAPLRPREMTDSPGLQLTRGPARTSPQPAPPESSSAGCPARSPLHRAVPPDGARLGRAHRRHIRAPPLHLLPLISLARQKRLAPTTPGSGPYTAHRAASPSWMRTETWEVTGTCSWSEVSGNLAVCEHQAFLATGPGPSHKAPVP